MQHGRYTVNRKLAEGGMAEIFLAKQHGSQGFEKAVVLKRIHAALYADEQFRNMLIDEAHISMGLMHNNIVQILDLGQSGGRYFLVLELIEGWDLGKLIRRAGDLKVTFPPELGLYVVAQVCRGLGYAHGKATPEGKALGIVHRDVSPQNVLLSEQGDVKLADFGIAKARRKRESTDSGVVKGKIAFMSPEQALGQELDARSDLYSLGTLLYLLVLGRRPFEGATDLEILLRVQKGEMTPPLDVQPNLHPSVAAVIERAMQFDRDQRFGSADEMLADIESALRSSFESAGQTELKNWLAELGRLDGEQPIGHHVASSEATTRETTSELEEGGDLVLGEDIEPTLLRESGSRNQRLTRMTGAEATVADLRIGPAWVDQESPAAIRSTAPSRLWSLAVMMVIALALAAGGVGVWKAIQQRTALQAAQAVSDQETKPTPPVAAIAPVPKREPPAQPAKPPADEIEGPSPPVVPKNDQPRRNDRKPEPRPTPPPPRGFEDGLPLPEPAGDPSLEPAPVVTEPAPLPPAPLDPAPAEPSTAPVPPAAALPLTQPEEPPPVAPPPTP